MPSRTRDRLADARLYLCTDARKRQGDLARVPGRRPGRRRGHRPVARQGHGGRRGAGAPRGLRRRLPPARQAARGQRPGRCRARRRRRRAAPGPGRPAGPGRPRDPRRRRAHRPLHPRRGRGRRGRRPRRAWTTSAPGPCWPTPTKPGRPAPGLDLVRYAAALGTDRPWFAIGGIDLGNLDEVLDAGARRVVVVRAITEADDPAGGAAGRGLADSGVTAVAEPDAPGR